jgi:dihydrofolate synthase/folylpolyglutamate synthase
LLPRCSRAIITRAKTGRALAPKKLFTVAKKTISDVAIIPDVVEAARHAIKTAGRDDVVCIAGSLYVVGEVKEAIEKGLLKSIRKT